MWSWIGSWRYKLSKLLHFLAEHQAVGGWAPCPSLRLWSTLFNLFVLFPLRSRTLPLLHALNVRAQSGSSRQCRFSGTTRRKKESLRAFISICCSPRTRILDFNGAAEPQQRRWKGWGYADCRGVTFKSILIRGLAKHAFSSTTTIRHTYSHIECTHTHTQSANSPVTSLVRTKQHNTETHHLH